MKRKKCVLILLAICSLVACDRSPKSQPDRESPKFQSGHYIGDKTQDPMVYLSSDDQKAYFVDWWDGKAFQGDLNLKKPTHYSTSGYSMDFEIRPLGADAIELHRSGSYSLKKGGVKNVDEKLRLQRVDVATYIVQMAIVSSSAEGNVPSNYKSLDAFQYHSVGVHLPALIPAAGGTSVAAGKNSGDTKVDEPPAGTGPSYGTLDPDSGVEPPRFSVTPKDSVVRALDTKLREDIEKGVSEIDGSDFLKHLESQAKLVYKGTNFASFLKELKEKEYEPLLEKIRTQIADHLAAKANSLGNSTHKKGLLTELKASAKVLSYFKTKYPTIDFDDIVVAVGPLSGILTNWSHVYEPDFRSTFPGAYLPPLLGRGTVTLHFNGNAHTVELKSIRSYEGEFGSMEVRGAFEFSVRGGQQLSEIAMEKMYGGSSRVLFIDENYFNSKPEDLDVVLVGLLQSYVDFQEDARSFTGENRVKEWNERFMEIQKLKSLDQAAKEMGKSDEFDRYLSSVVESVHRRDPGEDEARIRDRARNDYIGFFSNAFHNFVFAHTKLGKSSIKQQLEYLKKQGDSDGKAALRLENLARIASRTHRLSGVEEPMPVTPFSFFGYYLTIYAE
jgi:hypothetical protein